MSWGCRAHPRFLLPHALLARLNEQPKQSEPMFLGQSAECVDDRRAVHIHPFHDIEICEVSARVNGISSNIEQSWSRMLRQPSTRSRH